MESCKNHARVWKEKYISKLCTTHTSRKQRHGGTEAYAKKPGVPLGWSGKAWFNTNGYLKVQFYGVEVYVHRLIYLIEHGELPLSGWHVHHKDGNIYNNHPDNLVAMQGEDHHRLHKRSIDKRGRFIAE